VFNQAPCYEDVWVSEGVAPCILDLGTRWGDGWLHAPATLSVGKETLVLIGWVPEPVWIQ